MTPFHIYYFHHIPFEEDLEVNLNKFEFLLLKQKFPNLMEVCSLALKKIFFNLQYFFGYYFPLEKSVPFI
jgi:hypothetical protein